MQFIVKLIIVMAPVVAFLFYFFLSKNKLLSFFAGLYLILLIGAALYSVGKLIYANSYEPPKWDFLGFWLNGKVGLTGENFYDPKNYQKIPLPYDPGDEFLTEIVDVGFWYPPFTMFLFLPLGFFEISTAYLLWQALNLLVCVACIYGLWKLFLYDYGILSLLLIAMLMLSLAPTRSTLYYAQTNFLTLLFFLLFWRDRSKEWGGVWLALCVVVKPYMVILYLYPLITRKWKTLAIAIITLIIITLLSFLVFGSEVFQSYLQNPIPKTPIWNYTELTNQSLLATILRSTQYPIAEKSPLSNPLYLGGAIALTFVTIWVTIKNRNNDEGWVILSIVFLALIIYPANQMFYSVFIIVPVSLLLQHSNRTTKERAAIIFIILTAYFLSGYGSNMFFANLFMWFVCIIQSVRLNQNISTSPMVNSKSMA